MLIIVDYLRNYLSNAHQVCFKLKGPMTIRSYHAREMDVKPDKTGYNYDHCQSDDLDLLSSSHVRLKPDSVLTSNISDNS